MFSVFNPGQRIIPIVTLSVFYTQKPFSQLSQEVCNSVVSMEETRKNPLTKVSFVHPKPTPCNCGFHLC